jgi:hypothetical protein
MRRIGSLLLGVAFASGITAAHAQSVISRQITTEPVETVVTQGPNGTIVTRRPLGAAPFGTAPIANPLYPYPSVSGPIYPYTANTVETVETVEQPATTTVTREVVRPSATTRRERARSQSQQVVREPSRNTVVTREIVTPAPRAMQSSPPAMAISTTGSGYAESIDDDDSDVTVTNYVGMRLPTNVTFYDVPERIAVSMPGTRPYRYAYVGNRMLLVDPVTRIVVQDVTQ